MTGRTVVHIFDDIKSSIDKISIILDGSQFRAVFHPASAMSCSPPFEGEAYCRMAHFETVASHFDDILCNRASNNFHTLVLYSESPKLQDVVNVIKLGAFDFLKIPFNDIELKSCLTKAAEQSELKLAELREVSFIVSNLTRLTIQENKILEQMLRGDSNKIIAFNLNISQRTVENHRLHLMHKISARSITHLINMINKISFKYKIL